MVCCLFAGALLTYSSQTTNLQHIVGTLKALAISSGGWSAYATSNTPHGELLAAGFAHDIVQQPVTRQQLVCSEVAGYTWEDGEHDGLWSLLTAGDF